MKKLTYIMIAMIIQHLSFNIQHSFAQAPFGTPDNIGSGNCLDFDGTNDRVNLTGVDMTSFTESTVSCWIYLRTAPSANMVIFSAAHNTIDGGVWNDLRIITADISFDDVNYTPINPSSFLSTNKWINLTVTQSNSTGQMCVYVDGEQKQCVTDNFDYSNLEGTIYLGERTRYNSQFLDGYIDELSVWNKALTAAEIKDIMCKKLEGNESGLAGYWNMNEGSGATVNDLTINANHGTRQ